MKELSRRAWSRRRHRVLTVSNTEMRFTRVHGVLDLSVRNPGLGTAGQQGRAGQGVGICRNEASGFFLVAVELHHLLETRAGTTVTVKGQWRQRSACRGETSNDWFGDMRNALNVESPSLHAGSQKCIMTRSGVAMIMEPCQ